MAKTPTDIRSLARSHTETAIRVLAGVMQQEDAPPAARVAAANSLLDRGWGKPLQTVQSESTVRYVARLPEKATTVDSWQQQHSPSPTIQ